MHNTNIVALVGMMGSGKSTLGKILADKLHYKFIDLDTEIEKQAKKTITEIFDSEGEKKFRELETDCLKQQLSSTDKIILACGGGCFITEENRENLINKSLTIYLEASPDTLFSRLEKDKSRPLLQEDGKLKDKIDSILAKRIKYYELADCKINTDNNNEAEIIAQILSKINA